MIFLTELFHHAVEQRRDLIPSFRRFSFVQNGLHECLLFAVLPPHLNFQRIGARVTRRAAQPAGQNGFVAKRVCLARENDEHRLCDFLRQMRVAHLPQRHGIDEIDVAHNECGERLLGIAPGIFLQQRDVVIGHFQIYLRWRGKVTAYFCGWLIPRLMQTRKKNWILMRKTPFILKTFIALNQNLSKK